MNLMELKELLDQALDTCEQEGINPSDVNVNLHYQHSYPLWGSLDSAGFYKKDEGSTPEIALGTLDNHNGYSSSRAFNASFDSAENSHLENEW